MSSDLNTTKDVAAPIATTDVVDTAPAADPDPDTAPVETLEISNNDAGRCICGGCCCFYTAFDCKNIEVCCRYEYDWCFCVRHACCLSLTSKPLGCGLTTNKDEGDCCKVAAYCCDLGLVKPVACCSGAHACLCCYRVCSFPCTERFIDTCVCSYCFISCAPKCGCCVAPPACPALNKLRGDDVEAQPLKMDRGDDAEEPPAADAPPAVVETSAEVIAEVQHKVEEGEDKEMHA
jgi:hypothetical protein